MTAKEGMKEKSWIEFPYQPTGELIRFPVGTIHGTQDGPCLVVLGGMHGSEYCGIEAAIRLFRETQPHQLRGTLRVGMIYNLPAFQNNVGFLVPQDGINPGRTFPGDPNGSFSAVMAYHFTEQVLSKADYYVELHGGDIPEALVPFVIFPVTGNTEVDAKSRAMAVAYNIPLVAGSRVDNLPKPLHTSGFCYLALQGTPSILAESGQQGILDMADAERHLVGLRNILIHLGMLDGQITDTAIRKFSEEHAAIRSELVGMWYPHVKLGEMVKKDQVIGTIRDYFGDDILSIKALFDGHITVIRTSPNIAVGNVLIEMDRIVSEE